MRTSILTLLSAFLAITESSAQLSLEPIVSGMIQPVDIANAGDGSNRLFIVERAGLIKILDAEGKLLPDPFLDVRSKVDHSGGEEGLLGLVFHPDYAANGYFFVYYTQNGASSGEAILERYQVSEDPDKADLTSAREVLRVSQPQENHNGGDLAFGPQGNLYLGLGDGGSGNDPGERSQDLTLPLGKMLRINVDQLPYTVPPDNPFATSSGDTIREIWAWGLRNPWRFSFDDNYDLWIGDVGQSAREEINYIPAAQNQPGLNFGWDCREGNIECPGCGNQNCSGLDFTEPVYWYGPGPGLSVTGGYVLRGEYYDEYEGHYVFADFATNDLQTLKVTGGQSVSISSAQSATKISTFGKDEKGRIYAANYTGTIYRIVEAGLLPVDLLAVHIEKHEKTVLLDWQTGFEMDVSHFEIERSFENEPFKQIGVVPAIGNETDITEYEYLDNNTLPGHYLYRLKTIDLDGSFSYSMTLDVNIDPLVELELMPNPAQDKITAYFSGLNDYGIIQIVALNGSILKQVSLENMENNSVEIDVSDLDRGLLLLQYLDGGQQKVVRKLMLY
ncbi:MAG: PQQ-dependent sugar dehydrogenase [Saprospiraceae bacterium]|nr:PQQ-dependent sugar dehydrogenase [Saprospiraceae bacterium]